MMLRMSGDRVVQKSGSLPRGCRQAGGISGGSDGIYEFVVTAKETILEPDETNNESRVVFELEADDVPVLGPPDEVVG